MRTLIALTAAVLLLPSSGRANSVRYDFDDLDGEEHVQIHSVQSGNTLTWTILNVSPADLAEVNVAAITAFGFSLHDSPVMKGWKLEARDSSGATMIIGGDGESVSGLTLGEDYFEIWGMSEDVALGGGKKGYTLDYLANVGFPGGSPPRALYNPDVSDLLDDWDVGQVNWFTDAVFTATFDGLVKVREDLMSTDEKDGTQRGSPFVRMQRVGPDDGSLMLVGDEFELPPPVVNPVPEPASAALFGIGIAAVAASYRRRRSSIPSPVE